MKLDEHSIAFCDPNTQQNEEEENWQPEACLSYTQNPASKSQKNNRGGVWGKRDEEDEEGRERQKKGRIGRKEEGRGKEGQKKEKKEVNCMHVWETEYLQTCMIVVLAAPTSLILEALVFINHRKSSFNDIIEILGNVIF